MTKTFDFFITCDINWETKVDKGLDYLDGINNFFESKNYGSELEGICIVLICRSPKLKFKQRKKYSKKERILYLDIMLDYNQMVNVVDNFTKAKLISRQLTSELYEVIKNYEFKNFDLNEFKIDFENFLEKKGL